jgi:hypothetical protein
MPYGLTPTGFVRKPYEVIVAEMEAFEKGNTTAGPALNVSATSIFGQVNACVGAQIAEAWEALEALDAAFDPDRAEDAAQDNLYSLTNTGRKAATYSTVTARVNLDIGTTLLAGTHIASVDGNPQARFTPVANFTAPSTGNHNVPFVALDVGPVVANTGTLEVIDVAPGSGWNAVTNLADAALGTPIESSAAYRLRRAQELAAQGGGTLDGIRADLTQINDVSSAAARENVSDVEDENGLPAHSFEAIVLGGADQDIGDSIWKNKPAGIETHGNEGVEVVDSEGNEQEVAFSRPDVVEVYAGVTVTVDPDEYAGDAALEAAIVAATQDANDRAFLDSGDDVYAARLVCIALEVAGVLDVHVGLSTSSAPDSGEGDSRIVIGAREIAQLHASRIEVYDAEAPES